MNFNLKKPCGNCPFLKEGAISLSPGRLKGICDELEGDDWMTFHCHKTVHSKRGGEWVEVEDGDGETVYQPSGNESHCIGAAAYLYKRGKISVPTRLALMSKLITDKDLKRVVPMIIDAP